METDVRKHRRQLKNGSTIVRKHTRSVDNPNYKPEERTSLKPTKGRNVTALMEDGMTKEEAESATEGVWLSKEDEEAIKERELKNYYEMTKEEKKAVENSVRMNDDGEILPHTSETIKYIDVLKKTINAIDKQISSKEAYEEWDNAKFHNDKPRMKEAEKRFIEASTRELGYD